MCPIRCRRNEIKNIKLCHTVVASVCMSEHRAGHVRVRSDNITSSVVEEIALVEESLVSDISRTCQIVE